MSDSVMLAIATGVIGLLTLYVNQRHDAKHKELVMQNEQQARQIADNTKKSEEQDERLDECSVQHKECKDEHKATQKELEITRRELATRTAAENKRLQDQLDSQARQIEILKVKTGSKDT